MKAWVKYSRESLEMQDFVIDFVRTFDYIFSHFFVHIGLPTSMGAGDYCFD